MGGKVCRRHWLLLLLRLRLMAMAMSSLDGSVTSAADLQHWDTESAEQLRQLLMCTTLQLESTRGAAKAQEEVYQAKLTSLQELLAALQRERDEAHQRTMQLENAWGIAPWDAPLPDDDVDFLLSDPSSCTTMDEYITASMQQQQQHPQSSEEDAEVMTAMLIRSLPEKGKLLQAVMQAGPLLQTLMLAGPLPQWHHPPPGMESAATSSFFVPQASSGFKGMV